MSHGPHCLDGVTSAVAVARFHAGAEVHTHFANNPEINEVLRPYRRRRPAQTQDLWITDISWTEPATDAICASSPPPVHAGLWIDHHRSAIERLKRGAIDVPLAAMVVEDTYAASRLVFEYLRAGVTEQRIGERPRAHAAFLALERLVPLADDNDRWIHALPGSRELALTVAAMRDTDGVPRAPRGRRAGDLLADDEGGRGAGQRRARGDPRARRPYPRERRSATSPSSPRGAPGYPSEIADAWGKARRRRCSRSTTPRATA